MLASHLSSADSGWIEICGGEDGSYFVQTNQNGEGQEQGHDCNDCSLCVVSWNGANAVPTTYNDVFQQSAGLGFAFPRHYSVVTDFPEKHWSTSRAPPIVSIKKDIEVRNTFFLNRLYSEYFEDAPKSQAGIS